MSTVYDMQNRIELREIDGKAPGVFCIKPFMAGDTIVIGAIQRILNKNDSCASQIGENRYVMFAGLTSKLNHSCDPNCGIKTNEYGAYNFVAIRDGIANEEITFDYAMENYAVEHFPEICLCGSENCRGRITGWKDLPDEKKKEYAGYAAPYLLELDAKYSGETPRIQAAVL